MRNNTTNVATSSPLIVGQIYRVALHQKKSTGNNAVLEGFLVQGDAAFGAPFASLSNGTWTTQADTFKVGATISTAVDLVADNIQIDTTLPVSAPAPGITGFSPTNGSVGTSVTITGANFGATQSGGSVKFNGVPATTTWTQHIARGHCAGGCNHRSNYGDNCGRHCQHRLTWERRTSPWLEVRR